MTLLVSVRPVNGSNCLERVSFVVTRQRNVTKTDSCSSVMCVSVLCEMRSFTFDIPGRLVGADGPMYMVVWMQVQVMVDGGVDAGTGDG